MQSPQVLDNVQHNAVYYLELFRQNSRQDTNQPCL